MARVETEAGKLVSDQRHRRELVAIGLNPRLGGGSAFCHGSHLGRDGTHGLVPLTLLGWGVATYCVAMLGAAALAAGAGGRAVVSRLE